MYLATCKWYGENPAKTEKGFVDFSVPLRTSRKS